MQIARFKARYFRNLVELDLDFSPCFNFIYGANGSGKSSILEAIYFFSLGRSFRTTLSSRAIRHGANEFNLFSVILGEPSTTLGLIKTHQGKTRIKIGGNNDSISRLAKLLPMQFINPLSYQLLNGGPRIRRRFIDWGVFHVEPQFFLVWQKFQQILKQRNIVLRQALHDQIKVWNLKLVEIAREITFFRENYLESLIPLTRVLIKELLGLNDIKIEFYPGWNENLDFNAILMSVFHGDLKLGYTQYGPQRADLLIKVRGNLSHEILSRGEQKLLICALQLAQGLLLKKLTGKTCIYLFDDVFSELDSKKQGQLVDLLNDLGSQVFITVIDEKLIRNFVKKLKGKEFQIKKGILLEKLPN